MLFKDRPNVGTNRRTNVETLYQLAKFRQALKNVLTFNLSVSVLRNVASTSSMYIQTRMSLFSENRRRIA